MELMILSFTSESLYSWEVEVFRSAYKAEQKPTQNLYESAKAEKLLKALIKSIKSKVS